MFSLAHLSDLHLPPPPAALTLRQGHVKQRLAVLSWQRKRHRIHTWRPEAALRADILSHIPDHLAITGDLTNFAHPAEFAAARRYLEGFGDTKRLSVVPGNHDMTTKLPWQESLCQWQPWFAGDPEMANPDTAPFPFVRRRGPAAIIGLSSAIQTRVFSAAGRLGADQLDRLGPMLDRLAAEGLFRIVLIHHPPVIGPGGARKALRDRASLCAILARHGAELVLSGHHHLTRLQPIPGPHGPIATFSVPAALATLPRPEYAGWHLHRITPEIGGWQLQTELRRYDPGQDRFRAVGDWQIRIAAQ